MAHFVQERNLIGAVKKTKMKKTTPIIKDFSVRKATIMNHIQFYNTSYISPQFFRGLEELCDFWRIT